MFEILPPVSPKSLLNLCLYLSLGVCLNFCLSSADMPQYLPMPDFALLDLFSLLPVPDSIPTFMPQSPPVPVSMFILDSPLLNTLVLFALTYT